MNKKTSKEDIFRKSFGILVEKGFNHTGLNEILKAAAIPKGSFYNYFESKEDFGLQFLDFAAGGVISYIKNYKKRTDLTSLNQLRSFFEEYFEFYQKVDFKGGWPIGNFAQELGDINENFRIKTNEIINGISALYASFITEAKNRSEIDKNIDENEVADLISNLWQGVLLRLKTSKDAKHYEDFMKLIFEVLLRKD